MKLPTLSDGKMKTKDCKLRFPFKTMSQDRTPSARTTYLCKDRTRNGFMLKHWKCVGFGNAGCPLTEQSK